MSKPVGPYSPVLVAGDTVYVSGQLGLVDGKLVDGGVGAQVNQIFANACGLLERAGATLHQVVKCTVFLSSMDDFAEMNSAYVEGFGGPGGHRPCRSTVGNVTMALGATVEIEFTAYTGAAGVVEP
jgi:2-iminobutanoate/2-iminopropanoate deaminase